eukprot:767608-Amphidinium_carterae.2
MGVVDTQLPQLLTVIHVIPSGSSDFYWSNAFSGLSCNQPQLAARLLRSISIQTTLAQDGVPIAHVSKDVTYRRKTSLSGDVKPAVQPTHALARLCRGQHRAKLGLPQTDPNDPLECPRMKIENLRITSL